MRPDSRDAAFLLDMLRHAEGVVRAVAQRSLADYLKDEDLRLAVERRVEIIGEAARRVSDSFRVAHPEIPWGKIIAQRNVLVHEYGEVEDELMWGVAARSIPELVRQLRPLVPAQPRQTD